jgi:hypothetical protein
MHFLLIAAVVVIVLVLLSRTDQGGAMGRLGQVVYWAAAVVGLILVGLGIQALVRSVPHDEGGLLLILIGVLIWLAGWAFRYILTGNRSLR